MRKAIFFLLLSASISAVAESALVTGMITQTGSALDNWSSPDLNQNGVFTFHVAGLPNACGSGMPRIAIPTNHPMYQTVVSMVLSAQAQNREVKVNYLVSCSFRSNSWDFGTISIK